MKVLLLQLDGKWPNIALMRIAAHHRQRGDDIIFQFAGNFKALDRGLFDCFDRTYASLIFSRSRPLAEYLRKTNPEAVIGGTGWDVKLKLESIGVFTREKDYSIYPNYADSIGFTQRGCRLKCKHCVVPEKEGSVTVDSAISDIWRGEGYPKHLLLLDNDFFGQPDWGTVLNEIRDGDFKVSFNQGINARMLNDETAEAIASVKYYDDGFKTRRVYTAWDNQRDEHRLFAGLNALVKYGVKPDQIMVYILIGYWPNECATDREYRRARLREFGARPYPMPFLTDEEWLLKFNKQSTPRIRELEGFKRWVVGAYDKRVAWGDWVRAKFQPANLGFKDTDLSFVQILH